MKIEFWFDFASTYSYPAAMRIEELAAANNTEIVWRPFLLGAIFNKQGWNDSPFNIYPVKGEYMWKDLARVCDDLKIPFNRPKNFPQNGLLAARVACRFAGEPWVAGFIKSVFTANFAQGQDISSPEVISLCLKSLSIDPAPIIQEARTPKTKDMLHAQTDEAFERRIFGAPSFTVEEELFWGNDRLERAMQFALENAREP